ncbi:hypothetical protein TNCV_151801 [Trichonephila clavipes]|uniref:Uncharacterized protein n=1 Tax=Trichonephila clavipes TaxID=2585209 RepID=A0A8X6V500_TRICX|nr:hypothetical protein TNCV_151801 [Trichonephila clavipes]
MRTSEDPDTNGWAVADFSVMMVVVNLGPHQIGKIDQVNITALDSTLPTIRPVARKRVLTIHRRLIERNLRSN